MTEVKVKRRRLLLRAILAAIAILTVSLVQLSPDVPKPAAPAAIEATTARDAVARLRDALHANKGDATVALTRAEIESGAALASWVGTFGRIAARIEDGRLILIASRPLFGPFWLNARARVEPSPAGFPETAFTIGRIPLGRFISHGLVSLAAQIMRWRGARVPALDTLVQGVAITPQGIAARVHFPLKSGLANDLAKLGNRPVDANRVTAIYCRLMRDDKNRPDANLARVVNRAFFNAEGEAEPVDHNRAALVALSMYAVSPSAGRLAGDAEIRASQCFRASRTPPLLAGRPDLAMHWTLSAALSVTLGDGIGKAMGEWKEIADSRPSGTGFSFVDLSADRSGLAFARAASDPDTASEFGEKMRRVTNADILPVSALALSEGIPETAFVREYHDLDASQFATAVAKIDQVLSTTIVNR